MGTNTTNININIVEKIVIKRKEDIAVMGLNFGVKIPEKRNRPVNPFMEKKGVILEIKKASPSKGDIALNLDPVETAKKYRENGAVAISCLTEKNFFKGKLEYLIDVCNAVPDVAVLRKDFLLEDDEVDISYYCGADAVLLIARILPLDKLISMTRRCKDFGIKALIEVRTGEDVEKVLAVKKLYGDSIVCGVNSRNLEEFSIDLLSPCMLKNLLGGSVIFESGITTPDAAAKISSMGFKGLLLGEFAARNPEKAGEFIKSFENSKENLWGQGIVNLAEQILRKKTRPLVKICGLTRKEDVILADSLGADFVGFIFAREYGRNVCGEKFNLMKGMLKNVRAKKVAVITNPNGQEAKEACSLVKDDILDFVQLHAISYENVPDFLLEIPHYFAITDSSVQNGRHCGNNCDLPLDVHPDFTVSAQAKLLFEKGEPRFLQDLKNREYDLAGNHLWLAGGITAENVGMTVRKFRPELIDVSGGVEGNKMGIKDEGKMKAFFNQIKNLENEK